MHFRKEAKGRRVGRRGRREERGGRSEGVMMGEEDDDEVEERGRVGAGLSSPLTPVTKGELCELISMTGAYTSY